MPRLAMACMVAANLAFPALADCPGADQAAAAGVIVGFDDGSTSHLRLLTDGMVEDLTWYEAPGGDGYRVRALFGLYTVEDVGLEGGLADEAGREIQTFAEPIGSLPAPAPRLAWSGQARVVPGDDEAFDREVSVAVGLPEQVNYGGCRYESLPAAVRHRDDLDDVIMRFDYLPALGVAVLRALGDYGGAEDSYAAVSIRAAEPAQDARP